MVHRCLHKTGGFLQVTPEKAAKLFVACTRLHNMCIDDAVEYDGEMVVEDGGNDGFHEARDDGNAQQIRAALIAQL